MTSISAHKTIDLITKKILNYAVNVSSGDEALVAPYKFWVSKLEQEWNKNFVLKQDDKADQAARKIQALYKGYMARKPEDKFSVFPAIRNTVLEKTLGYKINGKIIEMPLKITSITSNASGAFKTLSHSNQTSIGLTLKKQDLREFSSVPEFILDKIEKDKLKTYVPQYRVNKKTLISRNLGIDLFNQLSTSIYSKEIFRTAHFKDLINDTEKLNDANVVHRDIKPENLFFREEEKRMYLSDLDSMDKLGKLKAFGTKKYTPLHLLANPNKYGERIDKICLLNTMIACHCEELPSNGSHEEININAFVNEAVKQEHRAEVRKLLLDPANHDIPKLSKVINWKYEFSA